LLPLVNAVPPIAGKRGRPIPNRIGMLWLIAALTLCLPVATPNMAVGWEKLAG